MAFPTTGILDDFSPDDAYPMTGWTDVFNGISASGGLGVGVSGSYAVSNWNTSYGPIQTSGAESYLTISTKGSTDEMYSLRLLTNLAEFDGYGLQIETLSGTDNYNLERYDNNVSTTLDLSTQEISNGDSIGIEIIGAGANNVKIYYKASGGSWSVIGQSQDTTYSGNAYPLVVLSGNTMRVDDLGGGTVAAAGAAAYPYHIFNQ